MKNPVHMQLNWFGPILLILLLCVANLLVMHYYIIIHAMSNP